MTLENLFESLKLLGGSKDEEDSIEFLKPNLVIKHKKAGVKYTISKVKICKDTNSPQVICYRYVSPNSKRKIYINWPLCLAYLFFTSLYRLIKPSVIGNKQIALHGSRNAL